MARTMEHEQLRIEVRGPERTSNMYVCKVIEKAFDRLGVNDMEVINQFGDDISNVSALDLFNAARRRNPMLGMAGVVILPDGPIVEEIEVFENPDRFEDDSNNTRFDEFDPALEAELEEY